MDEPDVRGHLRVARGRLRVRDDGATPGERPVNRPAGGQHQQASLTTERRPHVRALPLSDHRRPTDDCCISLVTTGPDCAGGGTWGPAKLWVIRWETVKAKMQVW